MGRQLSFFEDLSYLQEDTGELENTAGASEAPEVAADNKQISDPTETTLLDKILDRQNLNKAFKHVKRKGGSPGIDGMNVRKDLGKHLKAHSEEIIEQIRNRKYKPKPVKRVLIPKDKPGEFRKLGIPTGQDRVIQQAVAQVLTKIYEPLFSDNSFGFRPNRGCHKALKRVLRYVNEGYVYAVSIDLAKFFDSVPQMKLIETLQKEIKDNDVISLIHKFLKSGVIDGGLFERTDEGMPQGGPLSPLLSNIMLDQLDKELEKRNLRFVRYADDTIILCKSLKAANRVKESICRFIEDKLKLKVNRDKSKVSHIKEVKYLGYGFYYNGKEKRFRFRVHEKSKTKFRKKLKELTHNAKGISYDKFIKKLKRVCQGWVNYYCLADCKTYLRELDAWLRRRIRALFWRRWKRVRTRYKNFRKLGFSHKQALRGANIRKSPWRASNCPLVTSVLTNERLERWGFISLVTLYIETREKKLKKIRAYKKVLQGR